MREPVCTQAGRPHRSLYSGKASMSAEGTKSFQDLVKEQRQKKLQEEIVGRGDEVRSFCENLAQPHDARRLIFNVHGQGGVGKTFLIQAFMQHAEKQQCCVALCGDSQRSVVDVLAKLAKELQAKGLKFKAFEERYRTYQQHRAELEKDPELPRGALEFFTKATIRAGLWVGTQALGVSALIPLLSADDLGSKMADVLTFVTRKIKREDDIRLLRDPIAELTPLWLDGLREACKKQQVVLFFDAFERSAEFLDEWLRNLLLTDAYGRTPAALLFVIAGQSQLSRSSWADLEPYISRMHLEPFTEVQTRTFLERRGVNPHPRDATHIFKRSRGIPVLVEFLASAPAGKEASFDPHDHIVEHFLKGVESHYQTIALDAALPRWLNRDVLAALTAPGSTDPAFTWMKKRTFVLTCEKGWEYHPEIRLLMLNYKRQESPKGWSELHQRLANYYEQRQQELALAEAKQFQDEVWRDNALEVLYHRTCENPHRFRAFALEGFLQAWKVKTSFARDWAKTLQSAEEDAGVAVERRWGERLVTTLMQAENGQYQEAMKTCTALLKEDILQPKTSAIVLNWRSSLHFRAHLLQEAHSDLSRAIELAPEDPSLFAERGTILFYLWRYEEALRDLTHSIEQSPNLPLPHAFRCLTFINLSRHDEADEDLRRLIDLDPQNPMGLWLSVFRATRQGDHAEVARGVLLLSNRFPGHVKELREQLSPLSTEQLLQDMKFFIPRMFPELKEAPGLEQYLGLFASSLSGDAAPLIATFQVIAAVAQARHHQQGSNLDQAIECMSLAIDLEPNNPLHLMERSELQARQGRYDEALEGFHLAMVAAPTSADVFARRAYVQFSRGNWVEAIADLDRALELKPNLQNFLLRGSIHRLEGRLPEALADLRNASIESPEDMLLVACRIPLQMELKDLAGIHETYSQLSSKALQLVRQLKSSAVVNDRLPPLETLRNMLAERGLNSTTIPELFERLPRFLEEDEEQAARRIQAVAATIEAPILRIQGKNQESLDAASRAVALEPAEAAHHLQVALACLVLRRPMDAYGASTQALKLQPGVGLAHQARGAALFLARRYTEALDDLSHALEASPDLHSSLELKLTVYWIQGRYAEALIGSEQFIAQVSTSVRDLRSAHGDLLLRLGRRDDAQAVYLKLLQEDPKNWRAAYNLLVLKAGQEGLPAVEDELRDVKGLLQAARSTHEALALVRLAGLEALIREPERAFELLKEAMALEPAITHWAKGDPAWGDLISDKRFQDLLAETSELPPAG
ncbi:MULTISPECIES: ATP-binding protein [unclassified Corallococcus]|uniref:ATP-binding protein n=1 Tax=unclassified Corallococcus TaxID=2685029 RepID=UPI001F468158|nr:MULTISPECIES: ATP-binding protein [unclassified Corallococcus]